MTAHNYPDNLYADALGVIRKHTGAPTGAYRSADPVTKPAHYQRAGIETIDYIRATLDGPGFEAYCIGNVLKYVSRYREKGGVEDLRKAQVYLGWAISPKGEGSNPAAMREAKIAHDMAWDRARGPIPPEELKKAHPEVISAATHENPPKWSPEWAKANSSLHWVNPNPQVVCAGSPPTRLPDWAKEVGSADAAHIELTPEWTVEHKDGAEYWHKRTPNCDGLTARDIRATHPMQAEAIRIDDEKPGDLL